MPPMSATTKAKTPKLGLGDRKARLGQPGLERRGDPLGLLLLLLFEVLQRILHGPAALGKLLHAVARGLCPRLIGLGGLDTAHAAFGLLLRLDSREEQAIGKAGGGERRQREDRHDGDIHSEHRVYPPLTASPSRRALPPSACLR